MLIFVGFGEYFGSLVRFVLKPGHAEEWKPGKEQTRKPWVAVPWSDGRAGGAATMVQTRQSWTPGLRHGSQA